MARNTKRLSTASAKPHILVSRAPKIIDIRSSKACPLDTLDFSILDGLSQPWGNKTLPQLLLWDEKGQRLYDEILATREYYPYRIENELLQERVQEITSTIAASRPDLLVELGAGNMSKTAQLLSLLDASLSKPVVYYALDVDRAQLKRSLEQLQSRTRFRWITLCGLLGTYEDGANWLVHPKTAVLRKTLVWMGSSIANYEQHEASKLLECFARDPRTNTPQNLAGVFLLVDGCQDAARISLAYDVPSGESSRWVLHALEAAREHLCNGGQDDAEVDRLLGDKNWRFKGQWQSERLQYKNYLVPTRELVGTIYDKRIHFKEGERVAILGSGKWTRDTMSAVASEAGLEVRRSWRNPEFNYVMTLDRAIAA
ncbi:hypothetical protein N0V88_007563 [Collariella sp. IMI 366227]|nr:hypothetical protein N0V88_007563 [Collariella sp. IMI 366227]